MTRVLLVGLLLFVLAFALFSYKLTSVPDGLTGDEGAFGLNAVLLSRNLHDENDRFLPVFVLSLEGKDWRQPVMQYYFTLMFWLFGASLGIIKMSSAAYMGISAVLVFYLASKLLTKKYSFVAYFVFITSPIVVIHSHLALDNHAPIPFVVLWLIFLLDYTKHKRLVSLVCAGVFLGISFYVHKSMRSFTPVWSILTCLFLVKDVFWGTIHGWTKRLKPLLAFCLGLLPFFAVIPLLEYKYAGAIFGNQVASPTIYQFFTSYLASFDPSFLFVTGDTLLYHSTGIHGMFLLALLPLSLAGIYIAVRNGKFWLFLLAAFVFGPLLIGMTGSYHRASRLMALSPIFSLLVAFGLKNLREVKYKWVVSRLVTGILVLLVIVNGYDFFRYYWTSYSPATKNIFWSTEIDKSFKLLRAESEKRHLTPYIDYEITANQNSITRFLQTIYFIQAPAVWKTSLSALPKGSVILTPSQNADILQKIYTDLPFGHAIYIK